MTPATTASATGTDNPEAAHEAAALELALPSQRPRRGCARAFTHAERARLLTLWPDRTGWPVAALCRLFACSSKTLVREVRAAGLPLRKPQRRWNEYGLAA